VWEANASAATGSACAAGQLLRSREQQAPGEERVLQPTELHLKPLPAHQQAGDGQTGPCYTTLTIC